MYSILLLDHFQNPRNGGEIVSPDASVRVENPVCGDILELSIKLDGGRIADIGFRAKGCVPTMACGSAMTQLVKGKVVDEARKIEREDLLREVGGVPDVSTHACALALDALRQVLNKL